MMIPSQGEPAGPRPEGGKAVPLRAADWLRLAAAPTFAILALLAGGPGGSPPDLLCSTTQGASLLSGMVPMYVLMGAVHLAPWLELALTVTPGGLPPGGTNTPSQD